MDWKDRTYSLNQLRAWASVPNGKPDQTMMTWLRIMGIIPNDVDWKRRNSLTKTSLDGNAIRGGYLAELAYEWDQDGESTVDEFIDALEFEVNGTSQNEFVAEILGDLGR